MTDDWIKIVVCVPDAHRDDANQLERCLSTSEAAEPPFAVSRYQDADGNLYAVSAPMVRMEWLEKAQGQLTAPPWGADMEAAARAQVLLDWPAVAVSPSTIAACPVAERATATLAAMGLSLVPADENYN